MIFFLDTLQDFQTIHAGHFDIADYQIPLIGLESSDGFTWLCKSLDLVTAVTEHGLHHAAQTFFVVDQENFLGTHRT